MKNTEYSGTYIIWGPPGCGKTTTIGEKTRDFVRWASIYHPERRTPVLLCSLTRAAAAEIAARGIPVPPKCIGTLHAHAYRSLGCPVITDSHLGEFNERFPAFRLSTNGTPKKGDEQNIHLVCDVDEPSWERKQASRGDFMLNQYQLMRHRMTPAEKWAPRIQAFAAVWEQWKADAGYIDFTDMIEKAYREIDAAPGNPMIIIADEAQDLSALEYALLRRWGDAAGHLILTGDPWQALYVWRGAHPEIFIDPDVPSKNKKVLTRSWRVSRVVHGAAVEWISKLSGYEPVEYHPRDFEGAVLKCSATYKAPQRALELAQSYIDQGKSVMFAASCGFFLRPLLTELKKQGMPFSNPWRRRRGDWNPLGGPGVTMTQRLLAMLGLLSAGRAGQSWTYREVKMWVDVLKSKEVLQPGAKAHLKRLVENEEEGYADLPCEDYGAILTPTARCEIERAMNLYTPDGDNHEGQAAMLAWWRSHLMDSKARVASYPLKVADMYSGEMLLEPPRLFVGTIHSFKGSEADVVFLFPDLSSAGMREWAVPGAPRDSVIRMFYVGITRTREELFLCTPACGMAVNLASLVRASNVS